MIKGRQSSLWMMFSSREPPVARPGQLPGGRGCHHTEEDLRREGLPLSHGIHQCVSHDILCTRDVCHHESLELLLENANQTEILLQVWLSCLVLLFHLHGYHLGVAPDPDSLGTQSDHRLQPKDHILILHNIVGARELKLQGVQQLSPGWGVDSRHDTDSGSAPGPVDENCPFGDLLGKLRTLLRQSSVRDEICQQLGFYCGSCFEVEVVWGELRCPFG